MPHDRSPQEEDLLNDVDAPMTRRRFGAAAGSMRAALAFGGGCVGSTGTSGLSNRRPRWTVIRGALGEDVAFPNCALDDLFDPARVAIGSRHLTVLR